MGRPKVFFMSVASVASAGVSPSRPQLGRSSTVEIGEQPGRIVVAMDLQEPRGLHNEIEHTQLFHFPHALVFAHAEETVCGEVQDRVRSNVNPYLICDPFPKGSIIFIFQGLARLSGLVASVCPVATTNSELDPDATAFASTQLRGAWRDHRARRAATLL